MSNFDSFSELNTVISQLALFKRIVIWDAHKEVTRDLLRHLS